MSDALHPVHVKWLIDRCAGDILFTQVGEGLSNEAYKLRELEFEHDYMGITKISLEYASGRSYEQGQNGAVENKYYIPEGKILKGIKVRYDGVIIHCIEAITVGWDGQYSDVVLNYGVCTHGSSASITAETGKQLLFIKGWHNNVYLTTLEFYSATLC